MLKWVDENINADTSKLRFRYHNDAEMIKAVEQIELRRKAGDKFRLADGRSLQPRVLYGAVSVEQSTSGRIAAFHASLAPEARSVLDMTMGLGIDALAFVILNDARVTAIEMNPDLAALSSENYAAVDNLRVINANSVEWLKATDEQFDLIFIDPARRAADGSRVYNVHDCTPDVTAIMPEMLAHAPRVLIKLSPMLDITSTFRELPLAKAIYVVEERGECRELLVDVKADFNGTPIVVAVNGDKRFEFTPEEESSAVAAYGVPAVGDCVYEPWPSVMKAAPFKLLCERFACKALSANSHIYFSDDFIVDFPGKCYRVEAVLPYSSGVLKRFARTYGNASVTVRNFPISADALKKKLHVGESSTRRLLATTDANSTPLLLLLSSQYPVS